MSGASFERLDAAMAMMCAANRPNEFRIHLRGALKNGCTQAEIREVLLQCAVYAGVPVMREAVRAAQEVFAEERKGGSKSS